MTNFEEEIAKRDARIEELEAIIPIESNLRAKAERVAAELDRELAALKAQQPSAGVACALMSALEGIVHDQRVPNEVSQECAAVLIEARRLNPNPAGSGVALPDGWVSLRIEHEPGYPEDVAFGPQIMMDRLKKWLDRYFDMRLNPCRAQSVPAMARALADRCADACNVNRDDYWKQYGDDCIEDVRAMLAAAPSAQQKESGDE